MALAGLAVTVAVTLRSETPARVAASGGHLLLAGALAATTGSYLLLVTIMLTARPPLLERAVGQDRLLHWHRRTAPVALVLLVAHAVLVILGQAEQSSARSVLATQFLDHTSVMTATLGLALLLLAALTSSLRAARRRLQRHRWWTVHLLVYPAAVLCFWHTLTGPTFPGHPLVTAGWIILWGWTAGLVLAYRVLVPLTRTLRHRLVVSEVRQEAPGVVSVISEGRDVDRLRVSGGQYFQWRFLVRHLIWHAHPYSVSAMPDHGRVRLTVKDLGRASKALQGIRVGSSVLIEGPYGRFTRHAARTDRLVLIGAGIGVTPIRALLEDLPRCAALTVIVLAADEENVVFGRELDELVAAHHGELHVLLGGRAGTVLDRGLLTRLCGDLGRADVFVCGSPRFTRTVVVDARALGCPVRQIHHETFAWS